MNRRNVDDVVSAANPIDLTEGAGSPLTGTEREFLARVVAEAQQVAPASARVRGSRRGFAATAMTMGAIGAGALAFLFLGNSGSGPAGSPASAYAAELARIAEDGGKVVILESSEKYTLKLPDTTGTPADGWVPVTAVTVWDCTELPCVEKNLEEASVAGLIPDDVELRKDLPGGAELVVPPADPEAEIAVPPAGD